MNVWEEIAVSVVIALLHRFAVKPSTDAKVNQAIADIKQAVDAVATAQGA